MSARVVITKIGPGQWNKSVTGLILHKDGIAKEDAGILLRCPLCTGHCVETNMDENLVFKTSCEYCGAEYRVSADYRGSTGDELWVLTKSSYRWF